MGLRPIEAERLQTLGIRAKHTQTFTNQYKMYGNIDEYKKKIAQDKVDFIKQKEEKE